MANGQEKVTSIEELDSLMEGVAGTPAEPRKPQPLQPPPQITQAGIGSFEELDQFIFTSTPEDEERKLRYDQVRAFSEDYLKKIEPQLAALRRTLGTMDLRVSGDMPPEMESRLRERETWELAKRFFERTKYADPEKHAGVSGAAARAFQTPERSIPFIGGLSSMSELAYVLAAARKDEIGEKLTDAESTLLDSYGAYISSQETLDRTIGGAALEMALQMPAYMGEFILTGGMYALGRKSLTEVGRRAAARVLKGAVKKRVKRGALRRVVAAGTSFGIRGAAATAGAALGVGMQAPLMSSMYEESIRRQLPSIWLAETEGGRQLERQIDRNSAEGFWEALTKAYGLTAVEVMSERTGFIIGKPIGWVKRRFMSRWMNMRGIRTGQLFREAIRKQARWDGIIAEVFEEQVAKPFRAVIEERPLGEEFTAEQIATEALGIGLFGGASWGLGYGMSRVGSRVARNEARLQREETLRLIPILQEAYSQGIIDPLFTPSEEAITRATTLLGVEGAGEVFLEPYQEEIKREQWRTDEMRRQAGEEWRHREELHRLRLRSEQSQTADEHATIMAEIEQRETDFREKMEAEQERFTPTTTGDGGDLGEAGIEPEKRPYQEGPYYLDVPVLTTEEREGIRRRDKEERAWKEIEDARRAEAAQAQEEAEQIYAREAAARGFAVIEKRPSRVLGPSPLVIPPDVAEPLPGVAEAPPGVPVEPPVAVMAPVAALESPAEQAASLSEREGRIRESIITLEAERAKAETPEDLTGVEEKIQQGKEVLGRIQKDQKVVAEIRRAETKKPKELEGAAVPGIVVGESDLRTVTANYRTVLKVSDIGDLLPSHDPLNNFIPMPGYPEGGQERRYHEDKSAQADIMTRATEEGFVPGFLLSDSPGPEHGPPMTVPLLVSIKGKNVKRGVTAGGNNRLQILTLLYSNGRGDSYKAPLLAKLAEMGVGQDAMNTVQNMERPVLHREIADGPEDIDGFIKLVSELNLVHTRELEQYEKAVSTGKRITPETLEWVGDQLSEMGEGVSLRDFLRERGVELLGKLEADGVIADVQRRSFLEEKTGALNDKAKDFIESALLGAAIQDSSVLANAPKSALRKIERSLGPIARIRARGDIWDISDYLAEALSEYTIAAAKGATVEEHINPPTVEMFPRDPIHPIVEGIIRVLEGKQVNVKTAFEGYAQDSKADVSGQDTLEFYTPPTPWESFKANFGVDVSADDWGTVTKRELVEPVAPVVGLEAPPIEEPEKKPAKKKLAKQGTKKREKEEERIRAAIRSAERSIEENEARLADIEANGDEALERIFGDQLVEMGEEEIEILGGRDVVLQRGVTMLQEDVGLARASIERSEALLRGEEIEEYRPALTPTQEEIVAAQAVASLTQEAQEEIDEQYTHIATLGNYDIRFDGKNYFLNKGEEQLGPYGSIDDAREAWRSIEGIPEPPETAEDRFGRVKENIRRKSLETEAVELTDEELDSLAAAEILTGYPDLKEARDDAATLKASGAIRITAAGIEIDGRVIEKAVEIRSAETTAPLPEPPSVSPEPDAIESGLGSFEDDGPVSDWRIVDLNDNTIQRYMVPEWTDKEDPFAAAKKVLPPDATHILALRPQGEDEFSWQFTAAGTMIQLKSAYREFFSRGKKAEPEPRRALLIGRGARGEVRVIFPDKLHADLYSFRGRLRRRMRGEGVEFNRKEEIRRLAAGLGVADGAVEELTERYRDRITTLISDVKDGGNFEAPTFNELTKESLEAPPTSPSLRPSTIAEGLRGMADNDVQAAAEAIQKQIRRRGIIESTRQHLLQQLKPFEDELSRRSQVGELKPTERAQGYGEANTLFTKDNAESARRRLLSKLNRMGSFGFLDPEIMTDMVEIGGYHFESGIRQFQPWSKAMVRELGSWVNPHLRVIWGRLKPMARQRGDATLGRVMSDRDRDVVVGQISLFDTIEKVSEREVIPRGQEKREARAPTPATTTGVPSYERGAPVDEAAGIQAIEPARQMVEPKPRPAGIEAERAPGRGVPPSRARVTEVGQPRRARSGIAASSKITIAEPRRLRGNPVRGESEWKQALRDAGLPESVPPPTRRLSPEVEKKLIYLGQREVAEAALSGLDQNDGFVIATATGTGKTYTALAVIAEMRPKFGLILAPNKAIGRKWVTTAKEFGVDVKLLPQNVETPEEPGIYFTTYATARNRPGVELFPWSLVVADESAEGRRWYASKQGAMLRKLADNSEKALFVSATPFHTALELGYLEKLGIWRDVGWDSWARQFGVKWDPDRKQWFSPYAPRKLAQVRQQLIDAGLFINLDRDMRGNSVNFAVVPTTEKERAMIKDIKKAFSLAENYFLGKRMRGKAQAVRGNAVSFMKSYLERIRLPQAIETADKLEAAGWKVIFFSEHKKAVHEIYDFLKEADDAYRGEISRLMPQLPGVVETLRGQYGNTLGNFSGGDSRARQKELDDFNSGGKRHLYATYQAGGMGVDMHDTVGDRPRAAIYLGPPWSGVMFDQAIGRPWRYGAKSNVQSIFLTSDAAPEMRLIIDKIIPRMESLRALVSGVHEDDPILNAMRSLDGAIDYEFGSKHKSGFEAFTERVRSDAISSWKEIPIPNADEAKNKGMRVATVGRMERPPEEERIPSPPKKSEAGFALPTILLPEVFNNAINAKRRPLVSEDAEAEINDPRVLDDLEDYLRNSLGLPRTPEGEKPPLPPSDHGGRRQIPPPGKAEPGEKDLGYPAFSIWLDDLRVLPKEMTYWVSRMEEGIRVGMAKYHTAPYVLKQFKATNKLVTMATEAEMHLNRAVANMVYDFEKNILGDLIRKESNRRHVDEILRRFQNPADDVPDGEKSIWWDGATFTKKEIEAAQKTRDLFDHIIRMAQEVRTDVQYRKNYSSVIEDMSKSLASMHPDLEGKIPIDLASKYRDEFRYLIPESADPFSRHLLKRRGDPPKAFDILDIMRAYIPSMLKVVHYTPLSRKLEVELQNVREDTALRKYARKYVRILLGVPDEYKEIKSATYGASRRLADLSYMAALEFNPGWALVNLSQTAVNTYPELGDKKYAMEGVKAFSTTEGRELVARSGTLLDLFWLMPKPFAQLKHEPSKVLRMTSGVTEAINRGIAYLGGLAKARDLGMLGNPADVGEITAERLDELAAQGVDVGQAMDFAYGIAARSQFMYTNAHVQMLVRDRPLMMMFKSYVMRQGEFIVNMKRLSKEAKEQYGKGPEATARMIADGKHEYIDAVAKWHRLLGMLMVIAFGAFPLGLEAFKRVWPFDLWTLITPPLGMAEETIKMANRYISGDADAKDFTRYFIRQARRVVPGGGYIGRKLFAPPERGVSDFILEPPSDLLEELQEDIESMRVKVE